METTINTVEIKSLREDIAKTEKKIAERLVDNMNMAAKIKTNLSLNKMDAKQSELYEDKIKLLEGLDAALDLTSLPESKGNKFRSSDDSSKNEIK